MLFLLAGCSFHPGAAANGTDGGPNRPDAAAAPDSSGAIDAPAAAADAAALDGAGCIMHALPPNVVVDPSTWSAKFLTAPTWTCTGNGTTTIDSSTGNISNGCTTNYDDTTGVAQAGGSPVMVIRLRGLSLTGGHVIKLVGNAPVVFLVAGDVTIDGGTIDASAVGTTPGPGAADAATCDKGVGGAGSASGYGGGGGGFGTDGGDGGWNTENAGKANGTMNLVPLRGGCPGGSTNGGGTVAGGGGAFEISASGTITIGATATSILAAGGGGGPATSGGGNGGGAGGGILLVSPGAATFGPSGVARAHGGGGSSGNNASSAGGANLPGEDGHATDDNAAIDTSGIAGTGNNDHGRPGGTATYGANGLATTTGGVHPKTMNGRGGGGGGGGRIVVTTSPAGQACD